MKMFISAPPAAATATNRDWKYKLVLVRFGSSGKKGGQKKD